MKRESNWKGPQTSAILLSGLEPVSSLGECVEPSPNQAIDGHDRGSHHHSSGQQQVKIAAVGRLADGCSEADGGVDVTFEVKIFGDDARVPGSAGGRDLSLNKIRKKAGEEEPLAALNSGHAEDGAALFQIGRDRDCSCDYVKQDVPLRS